MPANLDNMDTEMDQDMGAETPDIGAEEPITDHGDQEGAMAKQELIKLASYATSLQDHISDDEQLEAWVQAKITMAATNIASVYHYMAYEKKIGEYSDQLETMPMNESRKQALKGWLLEAKAKVKELKKAHADKVSENAFDWKKTKDDANGDYEKRSSTGGTTTKKGSTITHKGNTDRFSDEPYDASKDRTKSHAKARSSADKAGERAMDKADEKESKAWGKANPGKQTIHKDGKTTTNEAKMSPAQMAHHHACEYAKHHKSGNLELAMHHKEACESCGGTITHGAMGECCHTHPHLNNGQMYECGVMMMEAKSKMAKKDYDKDGKIESGKDEYLGSRIRAAKKAGKMDEGQKCNECGMMMEKCSCMHESTDKTMSRAAKGVMKYGKEGMKALAKAGKEGKSLEPVKAKYNKYDESTKQRISENLDRLLSHYPKEVEHFKQGGELDRDLQDALWDYYFTNGEIRNYDADAGEFIADRLAYHLGIDESLKEGKPSVGLSAAKKSVVVKKAKAGGDIGKPGKGFKGLAAKAAKEYGSKEKGEKVAAAAMWKNIKETTAYVAEKAKAAKPDFLDMDKDGNKKESMKKAVADKKKETVKESTEFTRMQNQLQRLTRAEKPTIVESREVDQIRALTQRLLG